MCNTIMFYSFVNVLIGSCYVKALKPKKMHLFYGYDYDTDVKIIILFNDSIDVLQILS